MCSPPSGEARNATVCVNSCRRFQRTPGSSYNLFTRQHVTSLGWHSLFEAWVEQDYEVTPGDPRKTGTFLKMLSTRTKRIEHFLVWPPAGNPYFRVFSRNSWWQLKKKTKNSTNVYLGWNSLSWHSESLWDHLSIWTQRWAQLYITAWKQKSCSCLQSFTHATYSSMSSPERKITVHDFALVLFERDTYRYYMRHLHSHALLKGFHSKVLLEQFTEGNCKTSCGDGSITGPSNIFPEAAYWRLKPPIHNQHCVSNIFHLDCEK